jgi:hypothetical protein
MRQLQYLRAKLTRKERSNAAKYVGEFARDQRDGKVRVEQAGTVLASREVLHILLDCSHLISLVLVDCIKLGVPFRACIDGMWGFGNIDRDLQLVLITLVRPSDSKGFVACVFIIDDKHKETYALLAKHFVSCLVCAKFDFAATKLELKTDTEPGLFSVFEKLINVHRLNAHVPPDFLVGLCGFHIVQCVRRYTVQLFPARSFTSAIQSTMVARFSWFLDRISDATSSMDAQNVFVTEVAV